MFKLAEIYPALDEIIKSNEQKLKSSVSDYVTYIDMHGFYRLKAVGGVLIEFDADIYQEYLLKSGNLKLDYLKKSDGICNQYSRISQSSAFFDFLSLGNDKLATELSRYQFDEFCKKFEYEEDYLYVSMLYALLNENSQEFKRHADRAKSLFENEELVRLNICLSLFDNNGDMFGEVFEQLLDIHQSELEKQAQSLARDEISYLSNSSVFSEGLAVLRLAFLRKIAINPEYEYCPAEFVSFLRK